jgi:hypothetical protein
VHGKMIPPLALVDCVRSSLHLPTAGVQSFDGASQK